MTLKKIIKIGHTWLGLISAPIVFFVCITGTIIVFSDEIMELSAGEAKYVTEVKKEPLPTEDLLNIIQQEMPGYKSSYAVFYRNPERSVRFNCFKRGEGLRMVFIDQYTGEILKADKAIFFFYILAHLHSSLMWHGIGNWIIDIATIIFLIASITGLILWWPKKWGKKQVQGSLMIKTDANRKRLNYDLHKVLGFYGFGFSILLSITGLIIAFAPLSDALKNTFGGDATSDMRHYFEGLPQDSTLTATPINEVVGDVFANYPERECVQLQTFVLNESDYYILTVADKIGLLSAMNAEEISYSKAIGEIHYIPQEIAINNKIENIYWTLHMGNYMGIWGKIFTFIAGIIGSSLPVTGFIIWLGRHKKRK